MGALQAQDAAMSKWAIGIRIPNSTEAQINAALARGDLIRTHVMRPTWHVVNAQDVRWMTDLTAPRIKSGMVSRRRQLGLADGVLGQSNALLEAALRDGAHLTRDELRPRFAEAGIATDENRMSHLLAWAELCGVIGSGEEKRGKQTYALLAGRAPAAKPIPQEEAEAALALRYFTSHGPATLNDFVWWSGLPLTRAKRAVENGAATLISQKVGERVFVFAQAEAAPAGAAHLLPAFDEFIISYQDRSASLTDEHFAKAVSQNGMFWPVVLVDGVVVGTWKRAVKKNRVSVQTKLFAKQTKAAMTLIDEAAQRFAHFLDLELELKHD